MIVRVLTVVVLLGVVLTDRSAVADSVLKSLDHGDYDRWSAIGSQSISARGGWVLYRLMPENGADPQLVIQSLSSETRYAIPQGREGRVEIDEEWLVCRIGPDTSGAEVADLGLLRLGNTLGADDLSVIESVESYALPRASGDVVVWLHAVAPDSTTDSTYGDAGVEEKEGAPLVLRNLRHGAERRFEHVLSYSLSRHGKWLAIVQGAPVPGLLVVPTAGGKPIQLAEGEGEYRQLLFADSENQLAYLSNREDPTATPLDWSLYLWSAESSSTRKLAGSGSRGLRGGWHVAGHRHLRFSESGDRVFFGTAPDPLPPDSLSNMEKGVVLDVWSWTDDVIQPRQLVDLSREKERSYLAVVDLQTPDVVIQVADEAVPTVRMPADGESDWVLGVTDRPYRRSYGWDQQLLQDAYLIETRSGARRRIQKAVHGSFRLSPSGEYMWWWDRAQRAWFVQHLGGDTVAEPAVNVSAAIDQRMDRELHDQPALPGSYGAAGWLEGDAGLILYDAYDLWLVDPRAPTAPRCLTERVGRDHRLQFRLIDTDPEEALAREGRLLLSALDMDTKEAGFWRDEIDSARPPRRLWMEAVRTTRPVKADSADVLMMRIGSFGTFNDLWVSDLDLDHRRRLSDANPQQSEYHWGTAELVEWQSLDGAVLRGILYKPDDFDPDVQYPMITYFYERTSDYLHQHHPPTPHRSIIRFPFYTSRGYLVFVPDIEYRTGAPGASALSAIAPGVLKLIDQGFVDPEAIGLQGHSWGGYQAAFLITQTDLFACAVAGAVVSNMTSAYGGIRWATGVSRMYKYEKSQSRIGGTLWEETHRYLDNSPLFFADQVNTPLLMMHNDQDGAVPWYQGIEYFLALRRLGRPVWMLNYNGQPHWVTTKATQRDYATRMQQFFDHYLKGERAPRWMVEGIPATRKGQTLGLDPVD